MLPADARPVFVTGLATSISTPYGGWVLAVWTGTDWHSTDSSFAALSRGYRAARAPTLERLDVRVYATQLQAVHRLPLPRPEEGLCTYHQAFFGPEDEVRDGHDGEGTWALCGG